MSKRMSFFSMFLDYLLYETKIQDNRSFLAALEKKSTNLAAENRFLFFQKSIFSICWKIKISTESTQSHVLSRHSQTILVLERNECENTLCIYNCLHTSFEESSRVKNFYITFDFIFCVIQIEGVPGNGEWGIFAQLQKKIFNFFFLVLYKP